jgi:hypothetical protein
MAQTRKQKRGDLVRIDIGGGKHFCAVALTNPLFAFFDSVLEQEHSPAIVVGQPILFKLAVVDNAVKSRRWTVINKIDLSIVSALENVVFFKQDRISGKISAYDPIADIESPLSFEEADRLECAAVWTAEHVEDRLRDHLDGVPNKWWTSTRPRK